MLSLGSMDLSIRLFMPLKKGWRKIFQNSDNLRLLEQNTLCVRQKFKYRNSNTEDPDLASTGS